MLETGSWNSHDQQVEPINDHVCAEARGYVVLNTLKTINHSLFLFVDSQSYPCGC